MEEARALVANSYKSQAAVNCRGLRSMQIPNVVCVVEGKLGVEGVWQGRTRGVVSHPVGDSCAQVSSV